jgi:hypothetical protein
MAGLLDLAAASEDVPINGSTIPVRPLSARAIAHLLAGFPDLRAYFSGRELNPTELFRSAFSAVPAIIAAGMGKLGDAETEQQADDLPLDVQMDLVAAILRVTMPRGVGPFVEKFQSLGLALNGGKPVVEEATLSPN